MAVRPLHLLVAVVLATGSASVALASGREELAAHRRELATQHRAGGDAQSFEVATRNGDGAARGDVYAVLEHGFEAVTCALAVASNWCEIAPLHVNVKSCTYRGGEDASVLTFYSGRKFYERPEDATELRYAFRVTDDADDYFRVALSADEGPFDTGDYRLELEAIPAGDGATLVHLAYAYRYGFGARMALAGYLATRGSGKVGFSVVGSDRDGKPIYVDGMPGLVERNAVRYQLAIEAYLDTLQAPRGQRFERRIERWFDLTQRYRRQLFEMGESEYLRIKRRERSDQLRLQRELDLATLRP